MGGLKVRGRLLSSLGALFLVITTSAALAQEEYKRPDLQPLTYNSLFSASAQNNTDEVEQLLRRGENPNGLDTAGRSPLGYAALYGNTDMTKALLASGARPDFRDKFGNTALHWAAANGQAEVLRLLLAGKAPVDAANKQGVTPLMMAADANKLEAVRVLLAAGADPKKEDFSGRDAIGWAQGKPGSLRLLQQPAGQ
jgi:ankyrin repeat protein